MPYCHMDFSYLEEEMEPGWETFDLIPTSPYLPSLPKQHIDFQTTNH